MLVRAPPEAAAVDAVREALPETPWLWHLRVAEGGVRELTFSRSTFILLDPEDKQYAAYMYMMACVLARKRKHYDVRRG